MGCSDESVNESLRLYGVEEAVGSSDCCWREQRSMKRWTRFLLDVLGEDVFLSVSSVVE